MSTFGLIGKPVAYKKRGLSFGTYVNNVEEIVSSGLICYLDAANPSSYPGSGSTWFDLSGNGNHFTIVGSPYWSPFGFFQNTATISNYFIRNPFPHPTTTSTIEIWTAANINSQSGGYWSYAVTGSDNHHLLYSPNNVELTVLSGTTGSAAVLSGYWVGDMLWRHLVATSNRTTGVETLYINGWPVMTYTQLAGNNFVTNGSMILGQDQDSVGGTLAATQAFEGKISIFTCYNRVLSFAEIQQNLNAFRERYQI